jgi:hypothetical protein
MSVRVMRRRSVVSRTMTFRVNFTDETSKICIENHVSSSEFYRCKQYNLYRKLCQFEWILRMKVVKFVSRTMTFRVNFTDASNTICIGNFVISSEFYRCKQYNLYREPCQFEWILQMQAIQFISQTLSVRVNFTDESSKICIENHDISSEFYGWKQYNLYREPWHFEWILQMQTIQFVSRKRIFPSK